MNTSRKQSEILPGSQNNNADSPHQSSTTHAMAEGMSQSLRLRISSDESNNDLFTKAGGNLLGSGVNYVTGDLIQGDAKQPTPDLEVAEEEEAPKNDSIKASIAAAENGKRVSIPKRGSNALDFDKLCAALERTSMVVDSITESVQVNNGPDYCEVCVGFDFNKIIHNTGDSRPARKLTRRVSHIRKSKSCPFCRLTLRALEAHPILAAVSEDSDPCHIESEVFYDDSETHGQWESPNCLVRFNFGNWHEIFRKPPRPMMHDREFGFRALASDLHGRKSSTMNRFRGRKLGADYFDTELPRLWLSKCQEEHGPICSPRIRDLSSPVFTLKVIDVISRYIVNAPPACEYAALSYVWGNAEQLLLCKETRDKLEVPGGLRVDDKTDSGLLPTRTICDAILLCQNMDIRYLWVDALCIQQDSEDRMIQIQNMDVIYSTALLTIVAASGNDANCGMPGVPSGSSRAIKQHTETLGGVQVITIQPNFIYTMRSSQWKTRGWTFQEEALSCRLLFVTDQQLFFRRGKAAWSEDTVSEFSDQKGTTSYSTSGYKKNYRTDSSGIANFVVEYATNVKDYTTRNIKQPEDRLDAISGVLNTLRIEADTATKYLYGIPSSTQIFGWGLCWYSRLHQPDRRISRFPSWSWAGWFHPVRYADTFRNDYISSANVTADSDRAFNACEFCLQGSILRFWTFITKLRVSRSRATDPLDPSSSLYTVSDLQNNPISMIYLNTTWRSAQADELYFITLGPGPEVIWETYSGDRIVELMVTVMCIEKIGGLWYRVQLMESSSYDSWGTLEKKRMLRSKWDRLTNPKKTYISLG